MVDIPHLDEESRAFGMDSLQETHKMEDILLSMRSMRSFVVNDSLVHWSKSNSPQRTQRAQKGGYFSFYAIFVFSVVNERSKEMRELLPGLAFGDDYSKAYCVVFHVWPVEAFVVYQE